MSPTSPRIVALALCCAAPALVAAAAPAVPWDPDRRVVVAVEAPMSGAAGECRGGILGRKVLVIRADDRGNPDLALSTWGGFTYDSARILFAEMSRAGTTAYPPVMREPRATRGFRGATGTITIDPRTGDRRDVAVKILRVSDAGRFAIAG